MGLYALHDDPDDLAGHPEDRHYAVVWAGDAEEAAARFRKYEGLREDYAVACRELPVPDGFREPVNTPQVVGDPALLRALRYHEPGEHSCDTCGLYPMGQEQWAVCEDCYQCRECGCACEDDDAPRGAGGATPGPR